MLTLPAKNGIPLDNRLSEFELCCSGFEVSCNKRGSPVPLPYAGDTQRRRHLGTGNAIGADGANQKVVNEPAQEGNWGVDADTWGIRAHRGTEGREWMRKGCADTTRG